MGRGFFNIYIYERNLIGTTKKKKNRKDKVSNNHLFSPNETSSSISGSHLIEILVKVAPQKYSAPHPQSIPKAIG
jgi:hypothetical protein